MPGWAAGTRLLVSSGLAQWRKLNQFTDVGGEEHHVFLQESKNRVIKITRGGLFGNWIHRVGNEIRPRSATPLEYLARLDLSNWLFDDQIELIRVIHDAPRIHFVTTQPFLLGIAPSLTEMADYMESLDFFPIKGQ